MSDTGKVIATAGIIAVGVGTVNSFSKNHAPPSARFLIGSGAAFLVISAIGEVEPQVAQALAIAVMTTVLLGEGGGVLSYISGRGEIDTKKPVHPKRVPDDVEPAGVADEIGENIYAIAPLPRIMVDPAFVIPNLFGQGHSAHCRCSTCSGILTY